jgi:outer membrane protein TolC
MVVSFRKATGFLVRSFIILLVIPASGQDKKNYTLADFVDSARRHLPILLQKMALVNSARAGITDARHTYLPTAILGDQLSLGTDNSIPGSYLSFGLIPSSSAGVRSTNDYQSAAGNIAIIQSEYELLDFGLKNARVKNAEAYANLSQADYNRELYLLKWQVGKIYYETFKNQFQLGIEEQNVTHYQAIYRVIQAVTQSGIKAGADSSLALAELSKSRITYNQTLGKFKQLKEQLAYLTGIPADRISFDTSQTRNDLFGNDMSLKNTYADTIDNPLTNYYVSEKLLYLQTEDLVKKSYLPKLFLTGTAWARGSSFDYSGNYKSLSDGLGYQRFNYMAGATFLYDLFDGVHRKDKLAISHNNTLASDYDLQQQELSFRNIGDQADEAMRTAQKNLFEIPVQIKAAEDGFNQKTAQYKAGIINLIDLTNSSFVLYRAQSDYVQTLSDWLLANLDKAAATGNLDSFLQLIKK